MKGIIFNTEKEAKDMDWSHNKLTGSVSKYRFTRKALSTTTTLTKAQYAELYGIPATITDEDDVTSPNPKYVALESSYTLNKYASIVGDHLAVRDNDGNIIKHACPHCGDEFEVVDVSGMLKEIVEE